MPVVATVSPRLLPLLLGIALLPACKPARPPAPAPSAPAMVAPAPAVVAGGPVELKDVIETTPSYIVGISYPQAALKYPTLALALRTYADAAQDQLMQAVGALKGHKPDVPYDLSLDVTLPVETPRVVVAKAEGSTYLGGAHGLPLVERFVWLPQLQQMLAAEQLIPEAGHWVPVAAYVREQLVTRLSGRLDDGGLEGDARATALREGMAMIDGGISPDPKNFSVLEPVMNADGSIRSIRFVFPPSRVGPYSDGTQVVEVPAKVLLPLVAPAYQPLFRAG
ncbi:hypothetical protein [Thermomonas sp.]|uniref:DUF3298 and DUF4163 domain-containing protein n=1 Tax=Thermomonas sp. TaxID=1971895 RepID=UPI0035B49EE6